MSGGDLHEISTAIGRLTGLVEAMKGEAEARETRIRGDFREHRDRIHADVNKVAAHVAKVEETCLKRIEAVEGWQTAAAAERRVNRWWTAKLLGSGSALGGLAGWAAQHFFGKTP